MKIELLEDKTPEEITEVRFQLFKSIGSDSTQGLSTSSNQITCIYAASLLKRYPLDQAVLKAIYELSIDIHIMAS